MQISEKLNTFCEYFYCTFGHYITFETFPETIELHGLSISEVIESEIPSYLRASNILFLKTLPE